MATDRRLRHGPPPVPYVCACYVSYRPPPGSSILTSRFGDVMSLGRSQRPKDA